LVSVRETSESVIKQLYTRVVIGVYYTSPATLLGTHFTAPMTSQKTCLYSAITSKTIMEVIDD